MNIYAAHKGFWTPERKKSLFAALMLVALALMVHVSAGQYSSQRAALAAPESDLFLDNLPIIDLGAITVFGATLFWMLSFLLLSLRPRYVNFGLKAFALFIMFRAVFMNLTREGIYPGAFVPSPENTWYGFYHLFAYQGNLFFSAHTGFPFLMALVFWNEAFWRRLFLFATVFFGGAVLLAHVHYSIDVFAAPFIVYGVYVITSKMFPNDYALATGEER